MIIYTRFSGGNRCDTEQVDFDWERGSVTMSLIKAERTQLQRTADNGAVLQSVTIELSELIGEGW